MQTTNLPGKGLSHRSYLFKNNKDDEDNQEQEEKRSSDKSEEKTKRKTKRAVAETGSSPWGFFAFALVSLFFIYFGASALGLLPPNLLTDFLSTLTQWARQVGL
jgi:hypothetical protein